jgi:hypothetical protein
MHRYRLALGLAFASVFTGLGCGDEAVCALGNACVRPGDVCPPGVVCEAAGASNYRIVNHASVELWVTAESLGAAFAGPLPMAVLPDGTRAFAGDSIIGVNPRPADSFRWVALSVVTSTQGVLREVYRWTPEQADAWVGGRVDESDAAYGLSEYRLDVSDADLEL